LRLPPSSFCHHGPLFTRFGQARFCGVVAMSLSHRFEGERFESVIVLNVFAGAAFCFFGDVSMKNNVINKLLSDFLFNFHVFTVSI
jgi:hypothetical protein